MFTIIVIAILMCLFVSGTALMFFDQYDRGKFDKIPGTIIMSAVSIFLIMEFILLL